MVEYFSKSNLRWIIAQVHHAPLQGRLSYNLKTVSGQLRLDCGLGSMRRQLIRDEPVEFYNGERWLPASILGDQPRHATLMGYRIRLEVEVDPGVPLLRLMSSDGGAATPR